MALRPLTASDLDRVLELNNDAVPAVGTLDVPGLARLVDQSALALGLTAGPEAGPGHIDGFCLVLTPGVDYASVNYAWFTERYERFVYLDRIVIGPDARGRGHGRALYEHVERHALEHTDADWFLAEVNLRPRNDASLAFHERMGFAEVGRQETNYGALVSMLARPLR